jgi:hypothetical protein
MFMDNDVLSRVEDLDPELEAYVTDGKPFAMLRHPLVYQVPYSGGLNALANAQLKEKKRLLEESQQGKKWSTYIHMYERPWRMWAFEKVCDEMTDGHYWKNLASVWTDSENIWQNGREWSVLLGSKRTGRELMMDKADLEVFNNLPEQIQVYRGAGKRDPYPYSWSLSRDRAEWFANRKAGMSKVKGVVYESVVSKKNVLAYFSGRGEQEVVVFPAPKKKQAVETGNI